MKSEYLKKELGELIQQCTEENFKNGYDPITELIDEYESTNDISPLQLLDIEDNSEFDLTEDFLERMINVKKGDEDYTKIYCIDFYCNGFYYSKEEDDIFWQEWKTWDGSHLEGGRTRAWYYYFINRNIMHKYEEDPSILDNVEYIFRIEIDYNKEFNKLFKIETSS